MPDFPVIKSVVYTFFNRFYVSQAETTPEILPPQGHRTSLRPNRRKNVLPRKTRCSDSSRREYDRVIAEFIANGRQSFSSQAEITITSLILRFLDHMEKERNYADGTKQGLKTSLGLLNDLYGTQPVTSFSPAALKTLRRQLLEKGLCRDTINHRINRMPLCSTAIK